MWRLFPPVRSTTCHQAECDAAARRFDPTTIHCTSSGGNRQRGCQAVVCESSYLFPPCVLRILAEVKSGTECLDALLNVCGDFSRPIR